MAVRQKTMEIKQNYIENIIDKPLEKVMPESMMPYSEYVIMDRALPRVEDGLKPVQRRILYAMHDLGMTPSGAYKKSARIVGDCLGKYHPHGDRSVYDAMVRLAQDFNMRNTLVDGHGNFGSIDGDTAAAMRYTEVKLEPLAMELLRDIDKGTIKWVKNFDDTLDEPDILPGRFPNLLVNGAMGIAIGLATNIPPHNLTEVIDGCIAMINDPKITLEQLIKIIPGPDFPTGGYLVGGEDVYKIYETGRGKIVTRAKMDIENADGDRQNIIITEIPYQINKVDLQQRIYALKESQKEILGNITEVADESDRNGMRIVIKLKKGEDPIKVLDYLIKHTNLECNFNANIVAIAGGKPQQMGLIAILKYYLEYQRVVILKRSQYDIAIAKKREHILEGYNIVIPNIDLAISIIRNATSRAEAKSGLRTEFNISDIQAEAILNLQLGNINKLDVGKFEKELKELNLLIARLTKIIGSTREQFAVVRQELEEIRDKYKVKRLTTIISSLEEVDIKPYDPTKRIAKRGIIAIDKFGKVKFLNSRSYCSVSRDVESSGINGLAINLIKVEPEQEALVFGSLGNCYKLDTATLKEKKWIESGESLQEIYPDAPAEELAVCAITIDNDNKNKDIFIYTKQGMVKRSVATEYLVNKPFYNVVTLKDNDIVIGAEVATTNSSIVFVTSDGLCVNTMLEEYPVQGRKAGGVIGVSLNDNQYVVYATQTVVEPELDNNETVFYPVGEIVIVANNGLGKRVITREFENGKRNRKGVRIMDVTGESQKVIFATKVLDDVCLAIIDEENQIIELNTENIRLDNRSSKGKPIARGCKIAEVLLHYEEVIN